VADGRLDGGAVRIGDTVRRAAGPWPPGAARAPRGQGFAGAPRPLGYDEQGREVLTYLETVGGAKPWPAWAHAPETLERVARWMRLTTRRSPTSFRKRVVDHSEGVRRLAGGGDPLFRALVAQGTCDDLDRAVAELSTGCG
jgi:hypothetical protein